MLVFKDSYLVSYITSIVCIISQVSVLQVIDFLVKNRVMLTLECQLNLVSSVIDDFKTLMCFFASYRIRHTHKSIIMVATKLAKLACLIYKSKPLDLRIS